MIWPMRLSVVIPTLNESAHLPQTVAGLRAAAAGEAFEVVVSDCGSPDGTAAVARGLGLPVVAGGACRAEALNLGARASTGDVLLFLHADSVPPAGFVGRIRRALGDPYIVG